MKPKIDIKTKMFDTFGVDILCFDDRLPYDKEVCSLTIDIFVKHKEVRDQSPAVTYNITYELDVDDDGWLVETISFWRIDDKRVHHLEGKIKEWIKEGK